MNECNNKRIIHIIGLLAIVVGNLTVYLRDGMWVSNDSYGYISMASSREPGYSVVLWIMRLISGGEDNSYIALFVLQTVLGCLAAHFFAKTVDKFLEVGKVCLALVYIFILIYYGIYTALYPKWGATMLTNVCTEGICYSLFLIWMAIIIEVLREDTLCNWIKLCVITVLIFITRNSLAYIWVVDILCLVYRIILNKSVGKKELARFSVLMLTIGVGIILECSYFWITNDYFMRRTAGAQAIMVNIIRLSDEEDYAAGMASEDITGIYREVYTELKEQGCLISDKDYHESYMSRCNRLENSWETILYQVYNPVVERYAEKKEITNIVEVSRIKDKIAKEISKSLIKKHLGQWIKGYFSLWYNGFKRTVCPVLPQNILFDVYTAIVGVVNIGLLAVWWKNKKMRAIGLLSLFSVLGLISSTTLVIHCMSRYVLYNFVLVYLLPIVTLDWCIKNQNLILGKLRNSFNRER